MASQSRIKIYGFMFSAMACAYLTGALVGIITGYFLLEFAIASIFSFFLLRLGNKFFPYNPKDTTLEFQGKMKAFYLIPLMMLPLGFHSTVMNISIGHEGKGMILGVFVGIFSYIIYDLWPILSERREKSPAVEEPKEECNDDNNF